VGGENKIKGMAKGPEIMGKKNTPQKEFMAKEAQVARAKTARWEATVAWGGSGITPRSDRQSLLGGDRARVAIRP